MEPNEKFYDIRGTVTGRNGVPLRDARVVVWWQHIRERKKLAAGENSEHGRYHLRYRVPENVPQPLLLVVEALSEDLDAPLVSPLTQAQQNLEIDLNFEFPDQSEWATLVRSIEPLLDGLKLSELVENSTHQDISFLARELSKSTEVVMRVAVSARLDAAFKIPAPAFYAFLRQRVPAALPSPLLDASQNFTLIAPLVQSIGSKIFGLSAQVQTQTLTTAVALDLIGPQFTKQIPQLVSDLQALHATDLLNQPYLVGNATLAQLLDVAALPQPKQQTFAQALATNNQSIRNFWRTLGDGQHGFTAAEASAIERTLSVGAFVKNFVPLVQNLVQGFSSGTYKTLPELARLSLQDWIQLVNQTGAPPGIDGTGSATPAQVFASVVYNRVTRAYPTAALSGRIETGTFVPQAQQQPLVQFFQNNTSLELIKDSIPAYLASQGENAFVGISKEDQAAVVANARSFQRVLRVTPGTDAAQSLLGLGIKSATQIATLGQQQFFLKATAAGLTKPEANQAFRAAAQRYASVVSLYMQFNRDSVGVWPQAMGQLSNFTEPVQQAIQRDQSLATLFGSQDYCATDDCTSILSPAAYLCDLLLWLRNHPQGAQTALDVLDSRRPDIRHLLLNCPNTDTELPYIDLVNELLADKISPPIDSVSTSFTQAALINGTAYYYIVTAVNSVGESAPSSQVSATPNAPTAAPSAPAGVSAAPGNAEITIAWNPVAGAINYNIYWSTTPGVSTASGTAITGVTNPYIQAALTNGTTYFYIVTAVNSVGESVPSSQVSATPEVPALAPTAPTGVSAAPGNTQISISWNAVPGATGYNIYWSTAPGVTAATGSEIAGAANPYIQAALINGTTYFYVVTAVNSVGESAPSSLVSATPAVPALAPSAPTGVSATPGNAQITVSWNAVPGATGYDIYWSTTPGVTTAAGTEITEAWNPQWKQTSLDKTAAELSAAPEYFNQGAYVTLFAASYPFTLPYSAGLDELRTYLQQLGLPLWQLRQALLPLSGATVAQQSAVAAERFGISPHGEELVANPNFVPAPVAWNTTNPPTDVAPVPAFLQATSLTYESLLELLQVAWVQGGLNVAIQGIDDTCMTNKQVLASFSTTLASSITDSQTTITVASDSGFSSPNFSISIGSEILLVTAVSGVGNTTWTVARGQQATTAASASSGALVMPLLLDSGFLDRAHRFLRLWLATGYKMWELDLLVGAPAVGNAALDQNALAALLSFRQLQDAARLAVDQLLAFYQNIDTATHRDPDGSTTTSLYAQIFLNAAVTSVAPDSDLAVLPTGGAIADPVLSDHLAGIQAALGVSAADAATLFSLTNNQLTLANLSLIYRINAMAVASKYSISNLLSVATLLSPAAATPAAALAPILASPAATLAFLAQATTIQQSGLSLDALTYLLTPPSAAVSGGWATITQMTQANIATALGAVQQAVLNLLSASTTLASPITAASTSITVASDAGFPAPNFYVYIGSEILLVTAVGGKGNTTWTVGRGMQGTTAASATTGAAVTPTAGDLNGAVIAAVAANAHSSANPPLANDVTALILQTLLVPGVGQSLLAVLLDPSLLAATGTITIGGSPTTGDTLQAVLTDGIGATFTVSYTLTLADNGSVNQTASDFAQAINVSQTVVGPQAFLAPCTVSGAVITLTPLTPGAAGSSITSANTTTPGGVGHVSVSPGATETIGQPAFLNQFLAIQIFDKVGVLVRGLHLVATDLAWLLANAAVYGGFDFTQIPVTTSQSALSLPPLLTTLLLIKLDRFWTAAPPSSSVNTLYDVIGGVSSGALANAGAAQTALDTITGWPTADIGTFATALGLTFPASYTQPAAYDALRTLEAMATKAAATGAQIVTWGTVPPDEPTAESIADGALGVLKAQQASNDAWLALAPTLMNPIRENRSAALQAYLIAQRDSSGNLVYGDTDGLFDYFLIDVQMTSCQVTSRVVQAYIAVQIFVERCLMNLEAPEVVVDLTQDDTWNQWEWMNRYRVWEANREVFLYPENWLIESERPNRTEIYQKFEQEVRQGQSTSDYLETVVLNYIDRLDGLAHLLVTGTCEDPAAGTIYVVARTLADPPVFYLRSYANSAWTGWAQIPLDIKARQVVPALYRGRLCLFWLEAKVSKEPQQQLTAPQQSNNPPSQDVERYVTLGVFFSIFRNGNWAPAQTSKGKLFDKPLLDSTSVSDTKTVESLYTLKVLTPAPTPGFGANLWVNVFRFGDYNATDVAGIEFFEAFALEGTTSPSQADAIVAEALAAMAALATSTAVHVGRAVFDGRFNDLELNNLSVAIFGQVDSLLNYAQSTYGPDAKPLLQLNAPDPDLTGDSGLVPEAGALAGFPVVGQSSTLQLNFTSAGALEQNVGPLLNAAPVPLRVVGPDTDLSFDPASYFFFQDNRRCYWVESQKYYWTGSFWSPTPPSDPASASYQVQYTFHTFYHPFTRLFWNQLAGGDFDLLYDPDLQQTPDNVDPTYSDVFSFQNGYQPTWRVQWDLAGASTTLASSISAAQTTITVTNNIWVPSPAFSVSIGSEILLATAVGGAGNTTWTVVRGQQGTTPASASNGAAVTPTAASQDRQFLDFSYSAAFSVYNWELFYHIPLYVAQLLSQNQQFEDAQSWFHYIFNPTRQGSDPVPQRFWIPKPLHNLTSAEILQQQINNLLMLVNQGDATSVAEVEQWRNNSFNPFLLADLRNGVPYMKSTVMSYLDNLIAWGDNLFSTQSREALSEATLLYVIASEILGPTPIAVTPPQHADQSFDQLEPSLDAFANAMVEIENVIGGAGGSGSSNGAGIPGPGTFYFKIPSNAKLLGYWTTVADRLYKLRHCQTIAGAPLQLALFDAPIDPGLLIAAQAAGVDFSSVLSDLGASLPNYRFTSLYPQALDFVNAVRAYGTSLQAALQATDAGALALLQQTTQQQLLNDGSDILDWQVQQAQSNIDALNQTLALAQQKYTFNTTQPYMNAGEQVVDDISVTTFAFAATEAVAFAIAGIAAGFPDFVLGISGFGGTPAAGAKEGGTNVSDATKCGAMVAKALSSAIDAATKLATAHGSYDRRQDTWNENAAEAQIQITQANIQLGGAQLALEIAQQNQTLHQEQIDNLQQQIDFLNNKFTSDSLYDWMVSSLSATYFQSYQLAYQMCKQVERCYQFELGIQESSFIQFGYWDSLYKGLLAGETLNHDLRRMQASYLQQNARRFELSRYVSLGVLDHGALQQLLLTGICTFALPELLFDNDYPGHYNRRLTRVSLTVVYPNPGKFDNVKATLTLTANQVRISTDPGAGYPENPVGSDPRFLYNYAAVPQKIAMGNAQDDPGLFTTAIAGNIADQRYLPFENAGAISSWQLEMPQLNNEVDLSTVGDIVLHLYYTALDGGAALQQAAQANNAANLPTSGLKIFSAQSDFPAPAANITNPIPQTPWQLFLAPAVAPANQTLTLSISASKFPAWTRGKTISVTSITVLAVAWPPGNFVLAPQAPLPTAQITMTPVPQVTEPNICSTTIAMPSNTPLGTWSFQLQPPGATNFRSLTKDTIGDVLLLVSYETS